MKKYQIFMALAVLMLFLTACGTEPAGDASSTPGGPEQSAAAEPVQSEESVRAGVTEEFSYGDLRLTVTNVLEKRTDSVFDGMEDCEYEVYVVAPGAAVTVLAADMMEDTADGLPHADWAFLLDPADPNGDGRLDIVDGMAPVEITPEVFGIFDPESSLYVLAFELRES